MCHFAYLLALFSASSAWSAAAWTERQTPFRLYGNSYYVGSKGLSAVLVTSDRGHVLIDGDLPESVSSIAASIRDLGFRIEDVKYIVNSHAHYDHAGGIAGLQKLSGAIVMASTWSAAALRRGGGDRDDPQYSPEPQFEPAEKVQVIFDQGMLKLGPIVMTAHYTPGHTPGGTTWSWQSCEGTRCLNLVYADSLNAVSSEGFRFSDPVLRQQFEKSFAVFDQLPCDIIVSAHPEASGLWERVAKREKDDANGLIDVRACRTYARAARERWQQRLLQERAAGGR